MNISSWFRRSASQNYKSTKNPDPSKQPNEKDEEQFLGVTVQLIDFVKSFTLDTFRNFPLQEEDEGGNKAGDDSPTTSSNIRKDLSEWQERHATLVLSKVKEISQLRYKLCPRHMKEQQFWRIYFMLVKSYVSKYEQHAIRLAKLKRIAMENEKYPNKSAHEVEMAESKKATSAPPTSLEDDLDSSSVEVQM